MPSGRRRRGGGGRGSFAGRGGGVQGGSGRGAGGGCTNFIDRITEDSDKEENLGPVHDAEIKGQMDTCQHLVENPDFDVNIHANDGSGMIPLASSVSCGKVIAVRYLLRKGADLNKQDAMGFAPLHYAANQGYDGIACLLLSRGANVDGNSFEGTPLHVAAAHGKFDELILLEHHADPDRVSPDHCTPLAGVLCAVTEKVNESRCLKCMKLLVKAGADLNSINPDTPLAIATCKDLSGSADYLLEVGADANIRNKEDSRSIEIAAKSGRRGVVESLLPFTSPIRTVSDWSVEGIIAYARSRPTKDKGQESDEDSNIQHNLHDESVVRDDAGASRASNKDKLSDDGEKAKLKLHGGKAVSRMDYAGASKFYTKGKVFKCFILLFWMLAFCGTANAQLDNQPCNAKAVATQISGFCTSPNGRCCSHVISVVERVGDIPCICNVVKAGIRPDRVLSLYYLCGGKDESAGELLNRCAGSPPPPPPPEGDGKEYVGHPRWVVGLLVGLCCVAVSLSAWLGYVCYLKMNTNPVEQQNTQLDLELGSSCTPPVVRVPSPKDYLTKQSTPTVVLVPSPKDELTKKRFGLKDLTKKRFWRHSLPKQSSHSISAY